ncbi:transcriptional repressor [Streptacidiphilus sp. NEAU-YB345]|uniref:Transcriptional repressor n=1 Tax=Streptacidiphilus fuscans TaxID=2789292 RepID=A0A931B9L8_9ACTN|nr:transcriptional repressor [Streptacidiphilus fuscans]
MAAGRLRGAALPTPFPFPPIRSRAAGEPVTPANTSSPARSTRQRTAVASLLAEIDDFRSAQELHDLLKHRGDSVGLTTVYRTLQSLADAGEIDVLRTDDGEAVYRRCSSGHHHHLVCRSCGRTVEVEGPAVERWAEGVAADHGFVDVAHTLEIFGTCAGCAAQAEAASTQASSEA